MSKQTAPCQELQTRKRHEAEPTRSPRERIPAEQLLRLVPSDGATPHESLQGPRKTQCPLIFSLSLRQPLGFDTAVHRHV